MSDYTSLRPPLSPSAGGMARSSSPVGTKPSGGPNSGNNQNNGNAGRYSLGKGSTPTENMLRMAQQQQQQQQQDGPLRSPSLGSTAQMTGTPGSARNLRPSSELLNMAHAGSPESDAIDKWFEDLQHYEATLEEMAAASLDQNFKEELSAIEQWFRVLSEAERTAALYSLLQESTQVQIRFFITVLQQMARSDPVSALLSPSNPNQSSMAEQMEAKLASMGLKSPSAMKAPSSPAGRNYQRQSTGDAAGFLSPNAAMYSPGGNDAAATLAAQRAKLKANRISAPGTLTGDQSRNFSGGNLDQVQERNSPGPQQRSMSGDNARPKSTDLSGVAGKSPRASGPLDDTLSPITPGGNWASMVNTPLAPMFDENQQNGNGEANVNLDAAALKLANMPLSNQSGNRVMLEQDVSKYRRKSNQGIGQQQQQSGAPGVQGVLSGMYDDNGNLLSPNGQRSQNGLQSSPNLGTPNSAQGWGASDFLRSPMSAPGSAGFGGGFNMANIAAQMSPNALAALQSPTGGMGNPLNMQMMNAMAAMGGLSNMNAAQFLAMQQQLVQNQTVANMAGAMQSGMGGRQNNQRSGFAGGVLSPGAMPNSAGGRRSPRSVQSPGARSGVSAAGAEEEVADISILNDVPAWLRHLRLHKYTPNFEGSRWQDMVLMDDKALEEKGVAALGARRKMLKTFELVREKHGISLPGEQNNKSADADLASDSADQADS